MKRTDEVLPGLRAGDAKGPATPPAADAPKLPATLDTASLFADGNEVRLLHRGQEYRLRVTKQGKLILTK